MAQTIDVSGLSEPAVQIVESLVKLLRHEDQPANGRRESVFDLFGQAPTLRTADDIARQVQVERDAWGES